MTSKEEARVYLSDVFHEKCFWVNNGPVLKNMEELANVFAAMSDEAFQHHVNKEKNDFSVWVNEVIGDQKLANELLSSRNKASALKKVKNRLASLKKKAA